MKNNNLKNNGLAALALTATGLMNIAAPLFAAPTATGSTQTNRAGTQPDGKQPDGTQTVLDNIAAKLGRALSASETKEIKAALEAAKTKIEAANATLLQDIADAFGLTTEQVKTALQTRAPLVQTLSQLVGHKLTQAEIEALRAATKARADALKTIHDDLVETIASITGLTPGEAADALRPPPPPKPGDKPCDKRKCSFGSAPVETGA